MQLFLLMEWNSTGIKKMQPLGAPIETRITFSRARDNTELRYICIWLRINIKTAGRYTNIWFNGRSFTN